MVQRADSGPGRLDRQDSGGDDGATPTRRGTFRSRVRLELRGAGRYSVRSTMSHMKGHAMLRRWSASLALAAVAAILAGCGGDSADLRSRLDELEAENARLEERLEQLTKELRPLEDKLNEIDQSNRHLETAVAQASEDLQSRIHEMIQKERSGRRPGVVRPVPKVGPAEPEVPKPYLGFDGQTVTDELARELKLEATSGVLVTAVREGAPASVAGLRKDDVLQVLDGTGIKTKTELVAGLAKKTPGDVVVLAGVRGDEKIELKIKVGRR